MGIAGLNRSRRTVLLACCAALVVAVAVAVVVAVGPERHQSSTVSRAPRRSSRSVPRAAASPPAPVGGPPWLVRTATIELVDPTRGSPARGAVAGHPGRQLRTTLRWPVSATGTVAPGVLPLMVFAHGYATTAATYSTLLDDLARSGVVVAAPELPGESTAYPGPPVESDLQNEPCDLGFVGDWLERHPPAGLAAALTSAPVIVAGHSDGATAAAWAAYVSSFSSAPIRAVVALSANDVPMTEAFRFGPAPALFAISGTADEVNPLAHTVALYRHVPGPAWLLTLAGGDHEGTFTTDPDLARTAGLVGDFVAVVARGDLAARTALGAGGGGRFVLQSR